MKKYIALAGIAAILLLFSLPLSGQVTVSHLLCENRLDPMGIDATSPEFSWQLQGPGRNISQAAYEIEVTEGKDKVWRSGKVVSDQSVHVAYQGNALRSGMLYQWKVRVWDNKGKLSRWSEAATFRMGLLDSSDWKASWIQAGFTEDEVQRPAQYFRKTFNVKKPVRTAIAYVTAHGMYQAELNGKKVGNDFLTPGWTSYNKRQQYQVYDVKEQLTRGDNAIGVMAGNGWYRGYLAWNDNKNIYGTKLGVLVQLQVTYTDGSSEWVVTDETWKSSNGAVTYSEIYNGETVDHRKEQTGWSTGSFDDAAWSPVKVVSFPMGNLVATRNEPIRKHEVFVPQRIFTTPKGERVIDFGQNLVGWVIVKAMGKSGDVISIRHAEVLDKDGNFYTDNLRAAKATARYILRGGEEETFEPHFTFYGFRYIRIDDYPGEIAPEDFSAVALYSDMEHTGRFACSDSLINQLQHNIQWGQRGNFLDVPTDCPQRDERLGWTGDAQVFSATAAFNFGVNNFFAKWLRDVAADQLPNGSVPFVVPNVLGPNSGASAGWADVATIIPWNMYRLYGDKTLLARQYPSMKAWVEYMKEHSKEDLWNTGFHFGDWLFYRPFDDNDGRSAVTDKYLIAQCFFAHSTQLLINAALVLGNDKDLASYSELLQRVKLAFQREYMTPTGRLVSGTQTAYVLALQFDMLPENMRAQAADRLVENIKSYGIHLTTGFLGTPYLCDVLSRNGHLDIAYQLLLRKDYPSWLYPVTKGATTIWERWNGMHPDGTFEPASMNSFNHYAYGAIGDWMYRTIAGINADEADPGYHHVIIHPRPGGGLTHASASLETYYGTVAASWNKEDGKLVLSITIPANARATVYLPGADPGKMSEGGKPIGEQRDLSVKGVQDGSVVVIVGSGSYSFNLDE